jgi:hypothetical protein
MTVTAIPNTPLAAPLPIALDGFAKLPPVLGRARLTVRSDEAAKRKAADTDGTLRRARQLAENNRLL